ncbi:hypothetical protein NBM05_11040 [Rothia sp. AR01]|uniref:Methionine synthase n=1 Tax=Rothia santali TaxID=2949643 RepID=A0A9X2KIX5_9MICC|nr:hypothetical protein [Rothia santali]MCP3426520.1 hypothetical protein [Rothia santali]
MLATTLGRLPGTDLRESLTAVRGELGHPHLGALPELDRGYASTRLARTITTLEGLTADGQAFGWRVREAESVESRAAASAFASDVNALADVVGEEGSGHRGGLVLSLTGPVSLAVALHLANGEALLSDHGARRELTESLATGLARTAARLREALDGEELLIRWCEPALEAALRAEVPTSSGYRTLRALPRGEAEAALARVAQATRDLGAGSVLDAAGAVPEPGLSRGFDGIAVRDPGERTSAWEPVAAAVERGTQVWLGLTPVGERDSAVPAARRAWRAWRELGLGAEGLGLIRVEESRPLAGLSPERAVGVLRRTAELAEGLHELSRE